MKTPDFKIILMHECDWNSPDSRVIEQKQHDIASVLPEFGIRLISV